MKIIIFDTGTGGRLYTAYLRRHIKNTDIIPVIDSANSPYGQKHQHKSAPSPAKH
jgi:glutamate racemase